MTGCVFFPQSDGAVVGFITITSDVDLTRLNDSFDLKEFNGLYKMQQLQEEELSVESDSRDGEDALTQTSESGPQQVLSLNSVSYFIWELSHKKETSNGVSCLTLLFSSNRGSFNNMTSIPPGGEDTYRSTCAGEIQRLLCSTLRYPQEL